MRERGREGEMGRWGDGEMERWRDEETEMEMERWETQEEGYKGRSERKDACGGDTIYKKSRETK